MGMTIDKMVKNIHALHAICVQKDFYDKEFEEAYEYELKVLRQYMQIKEIVENDYLYPLNAEGFLAIRKVVENGKID